MNYDQMAALGRSNGSAAGDEFQRNWVRICMEAANEERDWIARLRAEGVKAAHPDDGWVDREANSVHFAYPQFDDGVEVGGLIALGWPDRHRLVRVTGRTDRLFSQRWLFDPT